MSAIVVPFDFSDTSNTALRYGMDLARVFRSRLHVLHVADVIATSAAQFVPEGPGDPEARVRELAMNQLRSILDCAGAPPETVVTVVVSSSPSSEICAYAKDVHADLIVVGTHGRSGVSRFLMGSVAEHVVRSAPCPVLVVRTNEHEFVVPDPVSSSLRAAR